MLEDEFRICVVLTFSTFVFFSSLFYSVIHNLIHFCGTIYLERWVENLPVAKYALWDLYFYSCVLLKVFIKLQRLLTIDQGTSKSKTMMCGLEAMSITLSGFLLFVGKQMVNALYVLVVETAMIRNDHLFEVFRSMLLCLNIRTSIHREPCFLGII